METTQATDTNEDWKQSLIIMESILSKINTNELNTEPEKALSL